MRRALRAVRAGVRHGHRIQAIKAIPAINHTETAGKLYHVVSYRILSYLKCVFPEDPKLKLNDTTHHNTSHPDRPSVHVQERAHTVNVAHVRQRAMTQNLPARSLLFSSLATFALWFSFFFFYLNSCLGAVAHAHDQNRRTGNPGRRHDPLPALLLVVWPKIQKVGLVLLEIEKKKNQATRQVYAGKWHSGRQR